MYRVAIIVNYQTLMNWNGAYCTMILKVQLNFVSYGDFVLFWNFSLQHLSWDSRNLSNWMFHLSNQIEVSIIFATKFSNIETCL